MLGAGIFMNTTEIGKQTGALGALAYALVGLLLLPLISSIAHLVRMHPQGGFYTFARKEISVFAGFISAWSYFTGKLASCAIIIHAAVKTLQLLVPALAGISTFLIDGIILSSFISLNMLDIKAGSIIQSIFIVFKSLAIACAIIIGFYLFSPTNVSAANSIWSGLPLTLPITLYAVMGFEAACSLSDKIKDAEKNAPRAIYISYGIVLSLIILYQFAFYGALGPGLAGLENYRMAFPALFTALLPAHLIEAGQLGWFFNVAITVSAFGGAYGLLFSNGWNLYTIARHGHVSELFTRLNGYHIPFACILAEGLLCAAYLIISQGNQFALQQVAGLATTMAYTLSVVSLALARKRRTLDTIPSWVTTFGLVNCAILICACIFALMRSGISSLLVFLCLLIAGVIFFVRSGDNEAPTIR